LHGSEVSSWRFARDNRIVEAEELRKKLKESEELLGEAEERQEEVEADIDRAHEHADVEEDEDRQ
jgi:hypothetical protein